MRLNSTTLGVIAGVCGFAFGVRVPAADDPADRHGPQQAIARALDFLQKDAVKWRDEHTCATCHHGTMTVWALSEAKSQGYAIAPEALADFTLWTKERLKDIDKPRDTRTGWNMVSTPAVYLAMMSLAIPNQGAISADELKGIAGHLVRHQETDGSWAWSIAPAKNRPPPVFESDEVVTLMAFLALGPHISRDPEERSDLRESREKAEAWLAKTEASDTTQARLLRLWRDLRANKPASDLQQQIETLINRQNKDGGWGQQTGLDSDAFATGQALHYLSLAGVKNDLPEMKRAVSFLVESQRDDGSWPMKSRSHPGATPMTNPVPITYFGSAWATLGLIRATSREGQRP